MTDEDYQFHLKLSEVKENLLKRSKTVIFLERESVRGSFPSFHPLDD